ncbi:acyl-CoA desaturase [Quadrisphaera sp. DSM 44207]|uniref:fatty acid desaturase family protein n=1 Tax=Quadrisphaera sp. DSM 44207 TaxID=1881057 RepID=UPI000886D644|nr:acyl-CoA desaturase [Quadrisphaera sp. DSM 44207]SDQ22476.1 Fatty acid desaturase [Quadrisphaera sp. DSM 44207]
MSLSPSVRATARASTPRQQTAFAELSGEVQRLGLMRRRYGLYWSKMIGAVVVLTALVTTHVLLGDSWWQLVVAALLAVALTQVAFLGHDAAHRQIFVSGKWNEWTSLIIANGLAGMSVDWWTNKHTKHHGNPNKVGKDPDIESGVLSFTPEAATGRRTGLRGWFTARQGWLFFPLLLLEGLNLHAQGLKRIFGRRPVKRRWTEMTLVLTRLGGYLAMVFLVLSPGKALAFLGVQLGLFGLYMGASFAPNHKGMAIIGRETTVDFLRRQVLTSRNIRGGRFVDVAMGGLNYQVEHHLFPSMPRPNLRRAAPVVQEYCRRNGIPYTQTGLFDSYRIVVRYLNRVGLGARDPFECPLVAQARVHR